MGYILPPSREYLIVFYSFVGLISFIVDALMAQVMFYRYTDHVEAALIHQYNKIELGPNQTCKWYTPDRYDTGADAQRFLAMHYTPTYRIGPIPSDELPDFDHSQLRVVGAANGQPGGGLEASTTKTMYLYDITAIP